MVRHLIIIFACVVSACSAPDALRPDSGASPGYLIANAAVLDIETGRLASDRFVLVREGIIVSIAPEAPAGVGPEIEFIDAAGAVLIPGLIDMHVHVFDEADLAANLAYGVTTVRNLGGLPFHLPMAERIERGDILGPRLITTGPILNERGGRNSNALQSAVSGADEARAAVRRQYQAGYRDLKLYSNLSRESFAAIRDEAARLGLTMAGHPVEGTQADPLTIAETLAADFVTIEHAESIVWFALHDRRDHAQASALAARFAEAGAVVSPTLIVHQNLARIVETRGAHVRREEMASFNPVVARFEADRYAFWAGYERDDRSVMQAFYVAFTGMLHAAGVTLVVGSDAGVMATPHGVSVSYEIELLVAAGLSPLEALQAATINPARALQREGELGRIAPGYAADFILLDGDPREDLSRLRRPLGVMRGENWLDEAALADLREVANAPSELKTWGRFLQHALSR
jgi:imidazolonepropionase-like amidohydrolase